MRRLVPLAAVLLAAGCGGHSARPAPRLDAPSRALLLRAFGAARALGRQDAPCAGCYPTDTSEITEDLYLRTGDQYAAAASAAQVRFRDVIYLDTAGRARLAARHVTFYVRARDGRVWRLDAGSGAPRIAPA